MSTIWSGHGSIRVQTHFDHHPSSAGLSGGQIFRRPACHFECRQRRQTQIVCGASEPEKSYGVFIEVDKILIDAHNSVHRVAFNRAFQELGYKSIHWTPEIFWQLVRSAAATPVSLVQTYFNTLGWPSQVERSQHQKLLEDVQNAKDAALDKMVADGDISLRAGVNQFLETTLKEGVSVSLISSTCSAPSERLVDAVLALIGDNLLSEVKIFQCPQGPTPSVDSEGEGGQTLEQKLRIETEKRKVSAAETLIDTVNKQKLGKDWKENASANDPGQLSQRPVGEGIIIDPSLLVGRERFASLNSAWLTACCATTGISLNRTALLSGTNALLSAGRGCGLFSVAVPSKYSARGTYPYADAVMDSFGHGGGVTWSWLSRKIDSGSAGQNRRRRGR